MRHDFFGFNEFCSLRVRCVTLSSGLVRSARSVIFEFGELRHLPLSFSCCTQVECVKACLVCHCPLKFFFSQCVTALTNNYGASQCETRPVQYTAELCIIGFYCLSTWFRTERRRVKWFTIMRTMISFHFERSKLQNVNNGCARNNGNGFGSSLKAREFRGRRQESEPTGMWLFEIIWLVQQQINTAVYTTAMRIKERKFWNAPNYVTRRTILNSENF